MESPILDSAQMYNAYQSDFVFNDFNFHPNEKGFGKRHMMIRYNQGKYYLKDLADGSGTFVMLEDPYMLYSNVIVSFSENHVGICLDDNHIIIKILEGTGANTK